MLTVCFSLLLSVLGCLRFIGFLLLLFFSFVCLVFAPLLVFVFAKNKNTLSCAYYFNSSNVQIIDSLRSHIFSDKRDFRVF